jgi:hypothetical protein
MVSAKGTARMTDFRYHDDAGRLGFGLRQVVMDP